MRRRIAAFGTLDFAVATNGLMAIGRVASPTSIYRTVRIASLSDARDIHARIALLGRRNQYAVAAHRHAGSTGKRTLIARLDLTSCGTAGISAFALVALLASLHDAVTANRLFTDACLTGHARAGGVFRLAVCRAAGATLILALVALFAEVRLHDTVAAIRRLRARARQAAPARFSLASGGTTIAGIRRIAGFTRLDTTVATDKDFCTLLARYARVPWVLRFAVCRTTRAPLVLAFVALFARVDDAIATTEA